MPKRHVRRRPAAPLLDSTPGFKGRIKRFGLSFTPRHFRAYWLSRDGLIRFAKLGAGGFVFILLIFLWYAKDLPTPGKINARVTAQTTKFYDASGNHLIYELYGDTNRSIVKFEEISTVAKQATIAIEDKDFYEHGAFSISGYLRAAIADVKTRSKAQGGSTITQQYVKNALLDPTDRSWGRKIKELILAIEIGQFYSKNDILTLYLNEIPYGARAYGIESACKTFFPMNVDAADKEKRCAKNLNLEQSALLAAILNGPSYYSPYGSNQPELIERQHLVLDLMEEEKYITKEQSEAAKWTEADLKDEKKISQVQNQYANLDPRMAHYVLYAQNFLEAKYGTATVTEGGLKVITTMDFDKQIAAYNAIDKNMSKVRSLGGSNAALVATNPKNGHVLSMIGSYDFNNKDFGNFNVANAQRQPGSSFKPIVYATLFAKNANAACAKNRDCPTYGPGTTLYDVPTNFGTDAHPYKPNNFGNKLYGVVTARQALGGSLNIPAVKVLAMAGVSNSVQTAQSLGINTLGSASNYGLSLVLGTGGVKLSQMANAYESFANGGQHYEQTPILKLYDQKGRVMEDNTKPKKPKQALNAQVASLMADVLSDYNAKRPVFGNSLAVRNQCGNNNATNCVHAAAKTGTTEKFNDAWTMGFTPDVVAGVWAGNNDNSPMNSAAANIAAPIWVDYMNAVTGGKPTAAFAKDSQLKTVSLDKQTGRAVTAGTKNTTVDKFPSWYVPMTSASGRTAEIDKVSGKLATACTPPLAKETVYSSAVLPEITRAENPSQYQNWLVALQRAGYSTSGADIPTASDDRHSCSDTKPEVNIVGALGGGPYNFTVQVTSGTFTANKLQVYFDDQIISTQQINGSGSYEVSYTPTQTGSHTFKAVVTDTGLYQATDEQAVSVSNTGSGSDFRGVAPAEGMNLPPGTVTFSWLPKSGASSYTLFVDNANRGSTSGNSRSAAVLTPGNHTWYVRSNDGEETEPITFRIQ
jgi:penicillin-binding protein 1A